jgi:hypothetical protein
METKISILLRNTHRDSQQLHAQPIIENHFGSSFPPMLPEVSFAGNAPRQRPRISISVERGHSALNPL